MSSQEQPSQVPTTEPIITSSSLPLYETKIPHTTSSMPYDSPLLGGDTPGSDEGSKKLNELTELCTKLFDKVTSLEKDLKQTKKVYGKALTKLVKKVKHLEDKLKSTTERRKARMVISDDDEDLITPIKVSQAKILVDSSKERVKTYKSYTRRRRSTVSSRDSTAGGLFSTAEEILSTNERIAQKLNEEEMAKAALDEREDTDDIYWNTIAKQVQERESDTIKRYQTLKKKPVYVAQARKNMMIYLKNMAGYKMNYFKGMSYDEIRPIFKEEYNKIQTLFKKDTEVEKTMTKRVAEETLLQESFKRLRAVEASRVGDHIESYHTFAEMLKKFDKDDLEKLWKLVKERFNTTVPTNDKEKELWVKLKRLFEPDDNDILWKLQRYMHDPLHWKLYDSCGVHHVSTERGHDIFMLVEKDYPLTKALMTVMLRNKLQVEESSEMANELLRKIFYEVNKPRS
ncbi:hypothetical protein Tco_0727755 [Tanacetum coccineum]|uniref:Uncharacterized protein n=1 Tax=Tanacetum coccineum TaxID=301880 RepID=A0ABQ4YJ71_9ASTR